MRKNTQISLRDKELFAEFRSVNSFFFSMNRYIMCTKRHTKFKEKYIESYIGHYRIFKIIKNNSFFFFPVNYRRLEMFG